MLCSLIWQEIIYNLKCKYKNPPLPLMLYLYHIYVNVQFYAFGVTNNELQLEVKVENLPHSLIMCIYMHLTRGASEDGEGELGMPRSPRCSYLNL